MLTMTKRHLVALTLAATLPLGCASGEEDTRAEAHGRTHVLVLDDGSHADGPQLRRVRSQTTAHDKLLAEEQRQQLTQPQVRVRSRVRDEPDVFLTHAAQDPQWQVRRHLEQALALHRGPTLGVTVEQTDDGLEVTEVSEGSLAAAAGVQVDDVLLRVGERKVQTVGDVRAGLAAYAPGDEVQVAVIRPGAGIVELSAPLPEPRPQDRGPLPDGSRGGFLGVELDDVSSDGPHEHADTGSDAGTGADGDDAAGGDVNGKSHDPAHAVDAGPGVRVAGVVQDSAAWYAGLQRDDRLLAVDGEELSDAQDLVGAVSARAPGTLVELRILRDGAEQTQKVRLGGQRGPALLRSRIGGPELRFFGAPDADAHHFLRMRALPDEPFGFTLDDSFDHGFEFDLDDVLHGLPEDLGDGAHSLHVVIEDDRMRVERNGMTTHYKKNAEGEWVPDAEGAMPDGPRTR
jgi:hypothetical protein